MLMHELRALCKSLVSQTPYRVKRLNKPRKVLIQVLRSAHEEVQIHALRKVRFSSPVIRQAPLNVANRIHGIAGSSASTWAARSKRTAQFVRRMEPEERHKFAQGPCRPHQTAPHAESGDP